MKPKAWLALALSTGGLGAQVFPAAISTLSSGQIVVADLHRRLLIIDPQSRKMQDLPLPFTPTDIAAGGRAEENLIFTVLHGSRPALSAVVQYSTAGRELRRWAVPGGDPAGVAFDYPRRRVYVAALPASVYYIDLNDAGGLAKYIAEVPDAHGLGALIVDAGGDQIYVASPFDGKVFGLSVSARKSSVIIDNLGEPSALAVGRSGPVLYVADRTKHSVLAVRLDMKSPRLSTFWSSKQLRMPDGLALDSTNTLWVADGESNALFAISPAGQLIAKFP
jgi:sugar lactone lactonase YvrE